MQTTPATRAGSARRRHCARVFLQLIALTSIALPTVNGVVSTNPAQADPAPAPGTNPVTQATAGALTGGTVPDGTCAATVTAAGGGGASSPTGGGITGGTGGAGGRITATFAVVPGQSYSGTVGAGAVAPTAGSPGAAPGGAGDGTGGSGGTIATDHRGGGGGGGSSVTFAGTKVLVAGGGGGGGAAHQNTPTGLGGAGGFSGIGAGSVAAGSVGQVGSDDVGNGTVGGGQGGQSAAGGAGGVQSTQAARNGAAGTGIGTGSGGNGGPDLNYDSGGGGGGGYTGGGGGSATIGQSQTGAGGGGGSSWVRGTSVDALATVPTSVTGVAGAASPATAGPGATGSISITWVPCTYNLALTKSVSSASVNAGGKVTWTLTVKNNGPNPMTKGDTVGLTDTLPAGPNGAPAPANKVTAITVSGGGGSGMATGALTCSGVVVGSAMPASTNCSRAYSAPTAVGAPSGGLRGLDSGEQIVITYEQIISNTAPCATITNTATVKDRPGATYAITTDTVNTNLTITCYDLAITKTVGAPTVQQSGTVTWTVSVVNNGPGPMAGPDDTTANPLVITDTFPAVGIGATTLGTQTGPAGPCSLAASTITCTNGLAASATETLTFTATVNAGTALGTVISNTASVVDPKSGDSNDSSTASVTVRGKPTLNLNKTVVSRANAADQFTVTIAHAATTDAAATTVGAGASATTGATILAAGTTYTVTDAMAAGSTSVIAQYSKSISCTNSTVGSPTVLPSGAGASFSLTPLAGDVISCTFSNSPTAPTINLSKSITTRRIAADQFTVSIKHAAVSDASATTSGVGTTATTGATTLVTGTAYTLSEVMAAGSTSTLADYAGSISCTNGTAGTATVLPSGSGTSFTVTPAAGDTISCTITNVPGPHLTLTKSVTSRVVAADQFTVAVKNGAAVVASATTSGVGTTAATGSTALTAGTTYTLTDAMAAGSTSTLTDYSAAISCTNSAGGSATVLPSGSGTSFSVTPANNDIISCTITNTAKPHLTLVKSVVGRVNAADQFTVAIAHGATTDATVSTSGAGVSATTGSTVLTSGTAYTLTDAMAGGSASAIGAYTNSISCTNANGASATVLPSGAGTSFNVTPTNSDNITCTITNTAKPHLTLVKSVGSRAVAADQFTVAIKNGASTVASATTAGVAASATTGLTTLSSATTYTLTDAMAAGSTSVIGQYASSISCSNATGGSPTVLPSGTGTSFSVTPANGDLITCTLTNTAGTATLGLTKTTPSTNVVLGNVITYTYGVTNTGSLPLTNVTVTDPMTGLSAITCAPAQGSTLASGATMSCTATYTVTQADVDAGSIINTGTVTGKDPSNNTIAKTASKTVTAAQSSSLTLTKAAVPSSGVTAGSVVAYTLSGKNTGTTTLHNVTVTDPLVGALSCTPATPATLAPNATISCTGSYTVTQANVDTGSIPNTATISGLTPSNNPVSATGSKTVTATQTSAVALTKTASPSTGVVAGTVVTYTFAGQNTGTVTLHNVGVTDPMSGLSAISCTPAAPATLAPNATISCTATYTVTQANVDAGSYSNTATINALNPSNAAVTNTASRTVTASTTSTLGLTKNAFPSSGVVAGSVVAYTITGTNTGVTTLHNVTVTDPLIGALSCTPAAPATLGPTATISCTGSYTVTQANVDAGSFLNTATINGLSPTNAPVTQTATKTVTATQTATLGLTKTASPSTGVVAGTVVTYTYSGQNTGTVTLHNVGVTDPHSGLSAITCTPVAPATLAPTATISCSAAYTVTQADVDAGSILNTGTIAGLDPSNASVTKTAAKTVTPNQTSTLSLTKSAAPSTGVVAGTVVTYTFAGQNTGTTTLHNVGVSDPMSGLSAITCTPAAPATLAPNATISCTATYTVTQANVDAGSFVNTATISGLNPSNTPVTQTASKTVTASTTSTLGLTKSAIPASGVVAGSVVAYTITGTNTGVTTLHNVTVADPLVGALSCTPSAPATLAPNATIICTGSYTVTQANVDAGSFVNTATINGLSPTNAPVTQTATKTVTASTTSTLGLTKGASPTTGVVAGSVVAYTITGTNTGVTTLHNVTVTDPLVGALSCTPATPATLAPAATISCSGSYTVTQPNVDAGSFLNTATIDGLTPTNAPVTQTATKTVTANQSATVSLTKSATPSTNVVAGTVVTYTFAGSNTGTVTEHNVSVTDPMTGLSAITCTPAVPATLAPNASINCTATRTITQADVDAGSVVNTATIHGFDPANNENTATASKTVTANQTSTLGLTKSASPNSGVVAGSVVTYTFAGQNTGTVTLHNVGVTDPMSGLSAVTCTSAAPATLAPNATISCSATYAVTQADVDAGSIANTATIAGLNPSDTTVTQTASATVIASGTHSLSLTKTPTPATNLVAGDVVSYAIHGTNTGAVTLHNVTVSDPMVGLGAITCTPATPATLAPTAAIDCSATYTVTQADVDAGAPIVNHATINGLDPFGGPTAGSANASVTVLQTPSLSIVKTATPNTNVIVGTIVTYSFTGTNTGTVTLHNVGVTDPMGGLGAVTCAPTAPATLAPNATISCSATYTVTQADVDAGSIVNTATISGEDPSNNPTTATGGTTVTTSQTASLALTKTASPSTNVVAGDVVTYTLTGTNTGAVSIHNTTITDPRPGLSAITCIPTQGSTLAANATITCSATYTVTQADVDAGSFTNTATINGADPSSNPVSATGSATVTTNTASTVTFSKTVTPSTNLVAGDVVTYDFSATNTGARTLLNTSVTDPLPGLSAITCSPAQGSPLAPGATQTCSATYTVTQADVDNGGRTNTATFQAGATLVPPVNETSSATFTTNQTPGIALSKTASTNSGVVAGDTVNYTFVGTNTGTVTLHGVVITDAMPGLTNWSCTPASPATIAPNAIETCTADYVVTQADVDAGSIVNSASITGSDPNNVIVTDTAGATVTATQTAGLTFTKTATPNANVVAGTVVTYTFAGNNSGTVTLHNVGVTDPMAGLGAVGCSPAAPATLAPGDAISCNATRTVTQADVDAGSIVNTATLAGLTPQNASTTKTASATVTANQTPQLAIVKTSSPSANVVAGTVVQYTFVVSNPGTVTVHGVAVTDPLPGLGVITCVPAAPLSLAPGGTATCHANYTVTQADVDSGSIANTATVDGLDPSNAAVTNTASATVTADQTAAITLTKDAVPTSGVFVGNTVTYTMTATNTGAVSLHNTTITDPMVGLSALSCTPLAGSTLGSGAAMTCTATYTVTQADLDAGSISNTATVTSDDPSGNPVTDTASKTVLAGQTASLALVKTATPNTGVVAGDTVTYGFDVTNNGTVSLHTVSVADPMPGLSALNCTPVAPATLAPNSTLHCDATYTVTQTNVNDGPFTNTATVTGLDPVNNPVSDSASATVTPDSTTSVHLAKTVSPDQGVGLGTLLTYTMTATNTGTTTLENARIIDPMTGLSALTCAPAAGSDLVPGASMTCTATYTVTAADVEAGEILNDATVSGHNLNGQTVTHAAAATVPTASSGTTRSLTLDKKLGGVTDSVATWTITVANPGPDAHPGPFTVTDPLPSGLTYESISGSGWNCVGTSTITCVHAGDLAAGAGSVITLKTKITGETDITNTASLDVRGTILTSKATYTPGSGFAFTGADAQRLGFLGLLGVLGGWFIVIAARKRNDDDTGVITE